MMFACSKTPAPNFRGDLKISDQNNWGGPEQNIKFDGGRGGGVEELNLRWDLRLKFYRGPMNPNDGMVMLKDILLC